MNVFTSFLNEQKKKEKKIFLILNFWIVVYLPSWIKCFGLCLAINRQLTRFWNSFCVDKLSICSYRCDLLPQVKTGLTGSQSTAQFVLILGWLIVVLNSEYLKRKKEGKNVVNSREMWVCEDCCRKEEGVSVNSHVCWFCVVFGGSHYTARLQIIGEVFLRP